MCIVAISTILCWYIVVFLASRLCKFRTYSHCSSDVHTNLIQFCTWRNVEVYTDNGVSCPATSLSALHLSHSPTHLCTSVYHVCVYIDHDYPGASNQSWYIIDWWHGYDRNNCRYQVINWSTIPQRDVLIIYLCACTLATTCNWWWLHYTMLPQQLPIVYMLDCSNAPAPYTSLTIGC